MNDITTDKVACDRFYKPLVEMTNEERREITEHTEEACESPAKAPALSQPAADVKYVEFAPEPMQMLEARKMNLNFIVGEKYPVLEKHESSQHFKTSYQFKTLDSKGNETWVDEKYFIPATQILTHGELFSQKMEGDDNLIWEDEFDVRKEAQEKNVQPLGDVSIFGGEYKVLAGTATDESADDYRMKAGEWKPRKMKRPTFDIHEGLVKDYGNDLMLNATKCMAAVEKVFGNCGIVDPDGIITAIAKKVPHLSLAWEDDTLAVNGAKTKISYASVQAAYSGLKGLVSTKAAEHSVAKLVANKLKKLF